MRLAGKVALVTGANSQGIGRAIALGFAREGADVAVGYVTGEEAAAAVVAAIRALGRRAVAVQADISQRPQVETMVDQVVASLGRIDCLANNAGVISHAPFLEVAEAMLDQAIAVNLKGTFLVSQAVARHMVQSGEGGSIVCISSNNRDIPTQNLSHYAATKGAIWTLARSMAMELVPYGIRVNTISPGTILTDFNRERMADPAFHKKRLQRIPMGRLGEPDDLVGAAVYLCSDEAGFVTGTDVRVDGGVSVGRGRGAT